MRTCFAVLAALSVTLFASLASAQAQVDPGARFGARGQVVLSDESTLGLSSTTWSSSPRGDFTVSVGPGVDWFVVRNLSLGLTLDTTYEDLKAFQADRTLAETSSTRLSGGVRVGYNLPVGPVVSFYPRLALGAESVHTEELVLARSATSNENGPWIAASMPVLFHVEPHFFLGLSPSVAYYAGNVTGGPGLGGQRVTGGADFLLGGWFGGPPVPPEARDVVPGRRWRFGAAGQVVLDSDITGAVTGTGYSGTSASSWSIGFVPGVDGFVVDHLSLGIGAGASYGSTISFDQVSGARATSTDTTFTVTPRVGVDIPLGGRWSVYPRASVGYGYGNHTVRSAGDRNDYQDDFVEVGAYAPVLVHPAEHFFVGLGPSIEQDVFHQTSQGTGQSLRTIAAASLTMGGWL